MENIDIFSRIVRETQLNSTNSLNAMNEQTKLPSQAELRLPSSTRAICAILQFLKEQGLTETYDTLKKESQINQDEYVINIKHKLLLSLDAFDDKCTPHNESEKNQFYEELAKNTQHDRIITKLKKSYTNLHKTNIISIACSLHHKIFATGAVDKTVNVFNYDSNQLCCAIKAAGPVLALDFNPTHPTLLLIGCMNGTHCIVDYCKKSILQTIKDHTSYINNVKWSDDGGTFITSSYDRTVRIYQPNQKNTPQTWDCVKELSFQGTVESLVVIKTTNIFVVGVRDDNYLHSFDIKSFKALEKWNLNAKGDDHVSFTPIHMSSSFDGKWLAVATDKHRVIMLQAGTNNQVNNFYGATNDQYSNPRVCWSHNNTFIYATSQDRSITCWDVKSAKVVKVIKNAHDKLVRDLKYHPKEEMLMTCSYDRTVKLWIV